ncbi:unnamed protein product [Coffea canephora]|uniref:Uncharacterized protein n=1 Tax=Coffea canephora TaxID=49390 RepID=A0A068UEG8_COFCA|nr:unnamed protein product [Coffea canephora]
MVVCRLRKNIEFHLDDSPRRKPQEGRHPSAANNNATASCEIEQTDVSEGAMLGDCWSKECSSNNNSLSTEQIESGFECDDKAPNELSPYAPSSHQKECNSIEEDYFADIMKDDIIQLDDSAIYASPQHLQTVAPEPESQNKSKQPAEDTHPVVFLSRAQQIEGSDWEGKNLKTVKLIRLTGTESTKLTSLPSSSVKRICSSRQNCWLDYSLTWGLSVYPYSSSLS